MAAPTSLVLTKVTGDGDHTLNAACRKVTIMAVGNDLATVAIGGDAPLLKDGIPIVFEDRNLGGTDLTFDVNGATISVFEEIGAGA